MAELVWQSDVPNGDGIVAEYRCGGGRVLIKAASSGAAQEPPEWVRVGQKLAADRIREYRRETGKLPTRRLLKAFQQAMGERLQAYIRDPMAHPYTPLTLRAFELEQKGKKANGDD